MILEPRLKPRYEAEKPVPPTPLPASAEGLGTNVQAPGSRDKPPLTGPQSPDQATERPDGLSMTTLSCPRGCLTRCPVPTKVAPAAQRDRDVPRGFPTSKAGTFVNTLNSPSGSIPFSKKGTEAACTHPQMRLNTQGTHAHTCTHRTCLHTHTGHTGAGS